MSARTKTRIPENQAFSLVELSIVLVILGLLVGGILSGQSLIRAAELRSVTTDYARYVAAVQTFRDKYFAIPGDMTNATAFWGTDADGCPTHVVQTAKQATCNGDGNGVIGALNSAVESFRAWQHMANAGLLEGSYTGVRGTASIWHTRGGLNAPRGRLSNSAWQIYGVGTYAGDSVFYATDYGTALTIGGEDAAGYPQTAILKPEEAWNIDTKLDDGKPARGKVITLFWNNACAAADDGTHAANDLNASYKLSDSTAQCTLYFPRFL